ncbi:hypothetical protein BESB_030920 [Besnoitia besnoiti]|uniref:Uncharacterized protein n=1 Tax=Besnoitia besnoiti TaxID=94643 RepID=A0A2A9LXK7_BESBE|nr:hypothetical protein BESB_030920 [Besnoitia besnoiti]PFH31218.1 hypothetical protein BESB_030920 [Besnoitia besnoiti]
MEPLSASAAPARATSARRERPVRACRQRALPSTGAGAYRPTCPSLLPCTEWIFHHYALSRQEPGDGPTRSEGAEQAESDSTQSLAPLNGEAQAARDCEGRDAPEPEGSARSTASRPSPLSWPDGGAAHLPFPASSSHSASAALLGGVAQTAEGLSEPPRALSAPAASGGSPASGSDLISSSLEAGSYPSPPRVLLPARAAQGSGGWPSTLLDAPEHAKAWSRFYLHHADSRAPFNSFTSRDAVGLLFRLLPSLSLSPDEVLVELGHGACPLMPFIWSRLKRNDEKKQRRCGAVRGKGAFEGEDGDGDEEGTDACEANGLHTPPLRAQKRRKADTERETPCVLSQGPEQEAKDEDDDKSDDAESRSRSAAKVRRDASGVEPESGEAASPFAWGRYVGIESCREAAEAALLQGRNLDDLFLESAPSSRASSPRVDERSSDPLPDSLAPPAADTHDAADGGASAGRGSAGSTVASPAFASSSGSSSLAAFSSSPCPFDCVSAPVRSAAATGPRRAQRGRGRQGERKGRLGTAEAKVAANAENGSEEGAAGGEERPHEEPRGADCDTHEGDKSLAAEASPARNKKVDAATSGGRILREMLRSGCLEFALCTDGFRYVGADGQLQLEKIFFEDLFLSEPRTRGRDRPRGGAPRGRGGRRGRGRHGATPLGFSVEKPGEGGSDDGDEEQNDSERVCSAQKGQEAAPAGCLAAEAERVQSDKARDSQLPSQEALPDEGPLEAHADDRAQPMDIDGAPRGHAETLTPGDTACCPASSELSTGCCDHRQLPSPVSSAYPGSSGAACPASASCGPPPLCTASPSPSPPSLALSSTCSGPRPSSVEGVCPVAKGADTAVTGACASGAGGSAVHSPPCLSSTSSALSPSEGGTPPPSASPCTKESPVKLPATVPSPGGSPSRESPCPAALPPSSPAEDPPSVLSLGCPSGPSPSSRPCPGSVGASAPAASQASGASSLLSAAPSGSALTFLKPGGVKYVVLKSTLDSICVMLPCTGTLNWEEDLRIPRQLVIWFDSFARLLQDPPSSSSSSSCAASSPRSLSQAAASSAASPLSSAVAGVPSSVVKTEALPADTSELQSTVGGRGQAGQEADAGANLEAEEAGKSMPPYLSPLAPKREAEREKRREAGADAREAAQSGGVLASGDVEAVMEAGRLAGNGFALGESEEIEASMESESVREGDTAENGCRKNDRVQPVPEVSAGNRKKVSREAAGAPSGPFVVFLEPKNKARIHLLTIFKVIYAATFSSTPSPARFLRLCRICSPKSRGQDKAVGYLLEKRASCFASYSELYEDVQEVSRQFQKSDPCGDLDDLLPPFEPVKWASDEPSDIEVLVDYVWSEQTAQALRRKSRGGARGPRAPRASGRRAAAGRKESAASGEVQPHAPPEARRPRGGQGRGGRRGRGASAPLAGAPTKRRAEGEQSPAETEMQMADKPSNSDDGGTAPATAERTEERGEEAGRGGGREAGSSLTQRAVAEGEKECFHAGDAGTDAPELPPEREEETEDERRASATPSDAQAEREAIAGHDGLGLVTLN